MLEIKIDPVRLREWARRIADDDDLDGRGRTTLDATERGMLAAALTGLLTRPGVQSESPHAATAEHAEYVARAMLAAERAP